MRVLGGYIGMGDMKTQAGFELVLESTQAGLEALSLLQTLGELRTWCSSTLQLLPLTQLQ